MPLIEDPKAYGDMTIDQRRVYLKKQYQEQSKDLQREFKDEDFALNKKLAEKKKEKDPSYKPKFITSEDILLVLSHLALNGFKPGAINNIPSNSMRKAWGYALRNKSKDWLKTKSYKNYGQVEKAIDLIAEKIDFGCSTIGNKYLESWFISFLVEYDRSDINQFSTINQVISKIYTQALEKWKIKILEEENKKLLLKLNTSIASEKHLKKLLSKLKNKTAYSKKEWHQIAEELHTKGYKKTEIAEVIGMSRETVSRYLNSLGSSK